MHLSAPPPRTGPIPPDPQAVLSQLDNVTPSGEGWTARCPVHDDSRNSLSIGVNEDRSRILIHCHAGCQYLDVLNAAGLSHKDMIQSWPQSKRSSRGKIVATYDYVDESGKVLYQALRYHPKNFKQRRPDGNGGWIDNLKGTRAVPYRLPEILAADPSETIFAAEGEKDCDRLAALGLVATCNSGGAGKWHYEFHEHFTNRLLAILPDNDDAGRKHALDVARKLHDSAASIKIIELPGLPLKGDVSDWLDAGGTVEQLTQLVADAPTWVPTPDDVEAIGQLKQQSKQKTKAVDKPNEADDDPHRLARLIIDRRFKHPDGNRLVLYCGEWREWLNGSYEPILLDELRAIANREVKDEFDRINIDELKLYDSKSDDGPPEAKKVTRSLVVNILDATAGIVSLPSSIETPFWIGTDSPDFDLSRALVTRRQIISLDSLASGSEIVSVPQSPRLFGGNPIGCEFDQNAPDPVEWKRFLFSSFGDDPDAIATLQMYLGYCLTADTSQQKILFIVGPKRSGKGTICRILTHIVGAANVAGPTLSSLSGPFGLSQLLGKPLAIISDARLSGRADQAIVVERLLSVSGEDILSVDRKHLPTVTTRLPTRFVICSNELPRLQDSSGALSSRFIVLVMKKSFFGKEDLKLESKLKVELPGILNWAIKGWQFLQQLGHFIQPQSGLEAVRELEDLGSPISAFVRECCEVRPGATAHISELYDAWRNWCKESGREHTGNVQGFCRDLRSAVSGLGTRQIRTGNDKRERLYDGIEIKG